MASLPLPDSSPAATSTTVVTTQPPASLPLVQKEAFANDNHAGLTTKATTNGTTTTTTTTLVLASRLVLPATPDQVRRQKRLMLWGGVLYALLTSVAVLAVAYRWLGPAAGVACSLGSVLGYAYGPVVLWWVRRVTGLTVGRHQQKLPSLQQEEGPATTSRRGELAAGVEEPVLVSVVTVRDDPVHSPAAVSSGDDDANPLPPPLSYYYYYRLADETEIARATNLLVRYGLVLFPIGIAPLVGLVTWQSHAVAWMPGVGCVMGYTVGCFYYPVLLLVTAGRMGQTLVWMHHPLVRLAAVIGDEPPLQQPQLLTKQCGPRVEV